MQNPKVTASIDKAHLDAIDKLKQKWTTSNSRVFSRNFCDALVMYGNLERSNQGRNILLLINRYAPDLKFDLLSAEEIDNAIALIISKYLLFNGIELQLPTVTTDVSSTESNPELNNSEQKPVKSTQKEESGFFVDPGLFESLDRG